MQALVSPHDGMQRMEDQGQCALFQDQWVEASKSTVDPTGYENDEFQRALDTRAIVLCDPKERFLSRYLDKTVAKNGSFGVSWLAVARLNPCREQTPRHLELFWI
jgi:hypothetical protein